MAACFHDVASGSEVIGDVTNSAHLLTTTVSDKQQQRINNKHYL